MVVAAGAAVVTGAAVVAAGAAVVREDLADGPVGAGEGVGVLHEEATVLRLNIMMKQTMTKMRRICP